MANAAASFEEFLQGWMDRQRNYTSELVSAQQNHKELQDSDMRELINRVLCHYEQYFEEKSKVLNYNIFLVFSPPWFSSLEKTLLWVAGFKPRTAFHVVYSSVEDLTEDQKQRLTQLSHETKMKERDLNDELAKVQESVAAPPLLEMARTYARRPFMAAAEAEEEGDGGGGGEDVPSGFKGSLENLVANADALRTNTAMRVVQILRPDQAIAFLAAVGNLQLRIRSLGLDKDAQIGG